MTKEVINGSTQHFGPRDAEVTPPFTLSTVGALSQLVVPLKFDDLPAADVEREDIPVIPANSIVTRVVVTPAKEAFVGGTSYNIGIAEKDGTPVVADGIFAAIPLAELNAGGTGLATEGATVGASVGTDDVVITAAETGVFTAGLAYITIEFIAPQVD
jgi:hypothetical protein